MIKRIPVAELKLGMFVQELHGSWIKHPFWKSRFLIDNLEDLHLLKTCGIAEVSIDLGRSVVLAAAPQRNPAVSPAAMDAPKIETKKPSSAFHQELEVARDICSRSRRAVIDMFREARMGRSVSLDTASEVVGQITESVQRNPHALISLVRLRSSDDYTYMHSVAVCAMMVALGRELNLSDDEVYSAGTSGLLHDVGKMWVPDAILNKPAQLTDDEFAIIKLHPAQGAEMLMRSDDIASEVVDVCLHHHEKYDGSGYPHGLQAEQISKLARMGAICDVYDAITSDRPYKKAWGPAESLQRMAQWKGHFDPLLFQAFIRTIGIYPTGSLVRLKSKRLAIVVEQNEHNMLKPKVKIFFSLLSEIPLPQSVLDLSSSSCSDSIESREPHDKWNFPFQEELWQSYG